MSIRTDHKNTAGLYFITFTCFDWLPLFQKTNGYDMVYKWFQVLHQKNVSITAYVIMPNHLHGILFLPNENYSLNTIISNAKRFMAYEIVKRLKQNGDHETIEKLQETISEKEKTKGQLHKVFEPSFDAKLIDNEKFMQQKIKYIHQNPVRGNYNLAKDWREYEHSSASFYELQQWKHFKPVHYMELH